MADERARLFEAHRPHLRAVGYRMLGSFSEADDAVQDAWFRFAKADLADIANLGGWLTTVTSRICLDRLRQRRAHGEESLDVFVPDPIVISADGDDPEGAALLADSVGLALLVVLETLPPLERLAFVLHDSFAVPFDEIAPIVDRSVEATRQLASRGPAEGAGDARARRPARTTRPASASWWRRGPGRRTRVTSRPS